MFSEKLETLLQERKIKKYHFSQQLGVSSGLISDYAAGKKEPSLQNIVKIADALNVSIDFLLGRTSIPEVNTGDKKSTPDGIRNAVVNQIESLSDHQAQLLLAFLEGLQAEQSAIPPKDQ